MKTFRGAYKTSKLAVDKVNSAKIEADHARLVESIKSYYSINDFSKLAADERESYRAMINEMWNRSTGLNQKGLDFLNESKAVLTAKSTDEQIKDKFQRLIKGNVETCLYYIIEGKEWAIVAKFAEDLLKNTGRKISNKVYSEWATEVLVNAIKKVKVKI